jgi:hypothetical protein
VILKNKSSMMLHGSDQNLSLSCSAEDSWLTEYTSISNIPFSTVIQAGDIKV